MSIMLVEPMIPPVKRGRGRPKGSKDTKPRAKRAKPLPPPDLDEVVEAIYAVESEQRRVDAGTFNIAVHTLFFPEEQLDHYRTIYEKFGQQEVYQEAAVARLQKLKISKGL